MSSERKKQTPLNCTFLHFYSSEMVQGFYKKSPNIHLLNKHFSLLQNIFTAVHNFGRAMKYIGCNQAFLNFKYKL